MLTLSQRLSQQQKLSPQQIQHQKLLQLNTLALEQRIKTELELNPILEEEMELSQETDEKDKDKEEETTTDEIKAPDNEEFSLEDYMNDDDFDHKKVYRGNDATGQLIFELPAFSNFEMTEFDTSAIANSATANVVVTNSGATGTLFLQMAKTSTFDPPLDSV